MTKNNKIHLCWACRSKLASKQIKCIECGSWQNWRKFLTVSNSTLSLLIALISVSTVGLASWSDFRESQEMVAPNIELVGTGAITVLDEDSGSVSFDLLISNVGTVDTLFPITTSCESDGQVFLATSEDASLLEVGDSSRIAYQANVENASNFVICRLQIVTNPSLPGAAGRWLFETSDEPWVNSPTLRLRYDAIV